MTWGSMEVGQTTGGVAPESVSIINDTTTLVAGAALIVVLLLGVGFMIIANYYATGSVWDFGQQRRTRKRRRRQK